MGCQPPPTQPRSVTVKPRVTQSGNITKHQETSGNIRKHQEISGNIWKNLYDLGSNIQDSRDSRDLDMQILILVTFRKPSQSSCFSSFSPAGGYGTSFASEANASSCDESESGAVDFYINPFPLLMLLMLLK